MNETADEGVIVAVDLRGIQRFVFEGRRLLDAIGRAVLVAHLTRTEPPEITNRVCPDIRDLLPEPRVLIRDAGGALILDLPGADRERARRFTAAYTRFLRDTTARLSPVVAHIGYGREGEPADRRAALDHVAGASQAARLSAPPHLVAPGLGVTAPCDVTGRPAEVVDNTRERGVAERRRAQLGSVKERVARDVGDARHLGRAWHRECASRWLAGRTGLRLPTEVDHLGREIGEVSRLAVIHLDFNGLGDTLDRYRNEPRERETDPTARLRRVSADIANLTEGLAAALVGAVADAITVDGDTATLVGRCGTRLEAHRNQRGASVPIRPIVVAGDDLTVMCDARLAWSVARFATRWLDADPDTLAAADPRRAMAVRGGAWRWRLPGRLPDQRRYTGVPTVGIGIAVQPVGAPLSVGYDVCERLCALAKNHWRADASRRHDHIVAWSLRFDDPRRIEERLNTARTDHSTDDDTGGRTEQPMSGTELRDFLHDYLDQGEHSLRRGVLAEQRSWLLSSLAPLLEEGRAHGPELLRRVDRGSTALLPDPFSRGRLLDALELLDLHMDLPLGEQDTSDEAEAS